MISEADLSDLPDRKLTLLGATQTVQSQNDELLLKTEELERLHDQLA